MRSDPKAETPPEDKVGSDESESDVVLAGLPAPVCLAHTLPEPCPTCRAYIAGGL